MTAQVRAGKSVDKAHAIRRTSNNNAFKTSLAGTHLLVLVAVCVSAANVNPNVTATATTAASRGVVVVVVSVVVARVLVAARMVRKLVLLGWWRK
jgi:hypothetical protein